MKTLSKGQKQEIHGYMMEYKGANLGELIIHCIKRYNEGIDQKTREKQYCDNAELVRNFVFAICNK